MGLGQSMNQFMLLCYIAILCHLSTLPFRKFYLKKNNLALSPLFPLMLLLEPFIHDLLMSLLSIKIVNFMVISLLTIVLLSVGIVTNEVVYVVLLRCVIANYRTIVLCTLCYYIVMNTSNLNLMLVYVVSWVMILSIKDFVVGIQSLNGYIYLACHVLGSLHVF